jgi:hypothetical protein
MFPIVEGRCWPDDAAAEDIRQAETKSSNGVIHRSNMAIVSTESALARADAVLAKADKALGVAAPMTWISGELAQEFRTAGLTLLRDFYGTNHAHYRDFIACTTGSTADGYMRGRGIVRVFREEVEQGLLTATRSLIAGELFADFLEMAEHLSNEGYRGAAAVIAGSTLEGHLRRLCPAAGVDPLKADLSPKKADQVNAELCKAGAYDLGEQKQITAWLDTRNNAAHGSYEKVDGGIVKLMIPGIRHFMATRPA